ncbi:MAG: CRISPR system precrRNA processing endoribonuclease RAMP protein Cas6 [Armatimonadetes bacterium]|nr:CRISPR system precrRNA processing endoribonuclease RAMP protein Cas6 [Armatimonadota bacterium]
MTELRIARYDLTLTVTTPVRLPPFAGSTLRGAFGGTFKRMVCVERHGECPRCLLRKQCAYPYIFETWIERGEQARTEVARPFVISDLGFRIAEHRQYATGDCINFSLHLFGRAIDYLPYFVLTFREAGLNGLGAGRGTCELTEVAAIHPVSGERRPFYDRETGCLRDADLSVSTSEMADTPPLETNRLTIEFLTYTRLMYLDHFVDRVEFHILISRLLRRLEALSQIHGSGPLDVDARDLINKAKDLRLVECNHRWHDWERYSSRQQSKVRMGGVLGEAVYEADSPEALAPYLPLLRVGELTHVGKGCVFGMGKIAATCLVVACAPVGRG